MNEGIYVEIRMGRNLIWIVDPRKKDDIFLGLEQFLLNFKIDLYDENNKVKSPSVVLEELVPIWKDLEDDKYGYITKEYIAKRLAGIRYMNRFIAYMDNLVRKKYLVLLRWVNNGFGAIMAKEGDNNIEVWKLSNRHDLSSQYEITFIQMPFTFDEKSDQCI